MPGSYYLRCKTVFRSPFDYQTTSVHLNTRLVWYSDYHCILLKVLFSLVLQIWQLTQTVWLMISFSPLLINKIMQLQWGSEYWQFKYWKHLNTIFLLFRHLQFAKRKMTQLLGDINHFVVITLHQKQHIQQG